MRARFSFLPYLKPLFVLTAFVYSARDVHTAEVIDFPLNFTFSAGFPANGPDHCLENPHCLQAYLYETTTQLPLLQISRNTEMDEANRNAAATLTAKQGAANYISRLTFYKINQEAEDIAYRLADNQVALIRSEVQARAEKEHVPFVVAQQEVRDKLFHSQYYYLRDEMEALHYWAYYHEINETYFMPKYEAILAENFDKNDKRRKNLDNQFDLQFLKQILLNLKIELGPASLLEYNQHYESTSDKWNSLFFAGRLEFKGKPLHHGVTFSSELDRVAREVMANVEDQETATLRFIMWIVAVASVVAGAGVGIHQCYKNTRTSFPRFLFEKRRIEGDADQPLNEYTPLLGVQIR